MSVATYRLYFFDRQEITDLRSFDADDDGEAEFRVAKEADGRAMELWRDGCRISVYPACRGSGGNLVAGVAA